MKKIIIKIILLSIYLNPIIILSAPQRKLVGTRTPALKAFDQPSCPAGQTVDCRNPDKCDTIVNLKTDLCNREGDALDLFKNKYDPLNNAFKKYNNISSDRNSSLNLMLNFISQDLPKDYALNMVTGTYERKSSTQDQSKYMALDKVLPTFFDKGKVDCSTLDQAMDEIKKQQFLVANPDEMYETIWNYSCSKTAGNLEHQLQQEVEIQADLMTEIANQRASVYNKVVTDTSGVPILKDNKLQFIYDPTIKSPIQPERKEFKVGPESNSVHFTTIANLGLVNLDKLNEYLNYLLCLYNFKTVNCGQQGTDTPPPPPPDSKTTDYIIELIGVPVAFTVAGLLGNVIYKKFFGKKTANLPKDILRSKANMSLARESAGLNDLTTLTKLADDYQAFGVSTKFAKDLDQVVDVSKLVKGADQVASARGILEIAKNNPDLFEDVAKMAREGKSFEEMAGKLSKAGVSDAMKVAEDLSKVVRK